MRVFHHQAYLTKDTVARTVSVCQQVTIRRRLHPMIIEGKVWDEVEMLSTHRGMPRRAKTRNGNCRSRSDKHTQSKWILIQASDSSHRLSWILDRLQLVTASGVPT